MEGAFPLVATALDSNGIAYGTADTWVEADPAKATRLLATLPDTAFRRAIGQAARTWFQRDPVAALKWAVGAPVGLQRESFDHIARDLKESGDLETLKALALATTSMGVRAEVARPLMDLWLEESPEDAFDWLGEHFYGFKARSVANISMSTLVERGVGKNDFAALTALAERLPPGHPRGGATYRILQSWTREDPNAAIAYAESLDPSTKNSAYHDLPANWAYHESAAEWLRTAPDLPIADSLLRYVIQKKSPAELANFAETLPPARAAIVLEALAEQNPRP